MPPTKRAPKTKTAESYQHPEADSPMRPEVGTQAQFKKKKPPQAYRYDSSLSPSLEWDGQNPAREIGEALIKEIADAGLRLAELAKKDSSKERDKEIAKLKSEIADTQSRLRRISGAFLNWSGKAERLSFDVPTLPLFIHERLSTKAIIETLKGHKTDKQEDFFRELWGDPQHSVTDQVLRAYEYRDDWVNRMMLGDSLVAMSSLLRYEALGGQVQMIYLDPPYGVKFGSNFQPFVRKRDVAHNDDEDMTREPEMVQAYPSGSIFVQISDENLHHVREVMDEVFGAENFSGMLSFYKTSSQSTEAIPSIVDYLLCYAKDHERQKLRQLFRMKAPGERGAKQYTLLISPDLKETRRMTDEQLSGAEAIPDGWKACALGPTTSQGFQENRSGPYQFQGQTFYPPPNRHWSYDPSSGKEMDKLAQLGRLRISGKSLRTVLLAEDNPLTEFDNVWLDTGSGSFTEEQNYVVQTNTKVIARCLLMTTDPGDLVLDPTCGSGTTAYVAEQWGRRWITIDTSRVPLALARQRLLTATFPYYELKDEERGPAGGFVYKRKQNSKGEETGGIVPPITLKSIANNEPPGEEVLVDRPEVVGGIVRVTGPFVFEATIPTPVEMESEKVGGGESGKARTAPLSPAHSPTFPPAGRGEDDYGTFVDRMLEVLRKSPVLRLEGNRTVQLKNIRPPAKSLSLSAEAVVECGDLSPLSAGDLSPSKAQSRPNRALNAPGGESADKSAHSKAVAIVFGPENGAVSEKLVYEAAREAHAKNYTHLYVIGFAIQPNARNLVDKCSEVMGVAATYVQATPDLMMGDLLKNMRSSQIFSVCGLPEVKLSKVQSPSSSVKSTTEDKKSKVTYHASRITDQQYQVELLGLDVFDPISMDVDHQSGNDVPAWLLDTDYNGLCFHVSQAFFPRTGAWENLKKALKGDYDETVWDHLAGTISAPFAAGEHGQIAVKVIDQRGNELLVVKSLKEAGK